MRRGVLQVVHAKYLYSTPLLHIDYATLDKAVGQALRRMFGLPLVTPLELTFAGVGLMPSKYYAFEGALHLLWRLRHAYWTKPVFKEWFSTLALPPIVQPSWAGHATMARFASIPTEVGLSWDRLYTNSCKEDWTKLVKEAVTAAVDRDRVAAAYRHGLFPGYDHLGGCAHRLTGDLACAVLHFRAPCLRLLLYNAVFDHGQCWSVA